MATFEITGPDGAKYDVNAPEGATEAQVMEYAKANWKAAEPATAKDRVLATTGGFQRGVAGILGLPVDTLNNVANLGRAGLGTVATILGRNDLAPNLVSSMPGGSDWIAQQMERIGINTRNPAPNDTASQMLYRAGTLAPTRFMPGASTGQTALAAGGAAVGEQVGGEQGAMIGSMLPAVASQAYAQTRGQTLANREQVNQQKDATAATARAEGYKLPPTETNPSSWMNRLLEGVAGKLTTRQMASSNNAEVTSRLAKESLGIPANEQLTEAGLRAIRDRAGQAYEAVKQFGSANNLRMRTDNQFRTDLQNLGGDINAAIREFPDLVRVPQIEQLQQSLNVRNMTPTAAVELSKNLRAQAADNARAMATGDPQARALMSAQRQAADAVEGLIERTLSRSGQRQLYQDYRNARTLIARSHDVETALNPATGTVDARILSRLDDKRPLGGGLDVAANTFKAFPKAMQTPESIGSQPGISPLDFSLGTALGLGGVSNFGTAGAAAALTPFIRPTVRAGIMSDFYQNRMGTPSYDPLLQPDSPLAMLLRGNLTANQVQKQ